MNISLYAFKCVYIKYHIGLEYDTDQIQKHAIESAMTVVIKLETQ